MNQHNPETGEIIEDQTPTKRNKAYQVFSLFIQGLENGQLNQDATDALETIAQELNDHILNTGKRLTDAQT